MIEIPHPDRYLRYTYLDDAVEPELNFVERPLAMLYRTLMSSRGRLRHVQTTELCLARVKNFLPIWAQTALKGMGNHKKTAKVPQGDLFASSRRPSARTCFLGDRLLRATGGRVIRSLVSIARSAPSASAVRSRR